ncbi:YnbE family lipoprotein [Marinobacter panjinensis]|uniref:YnbE family lipoprotein n=1 Tax=Marinobacter panjinensis TaxID=2576384 RepID=A0A4U6QVH0_9GAMM|nr:YnbE family lipoprotein [Marinobacter panjinensis]MCR8915094.1 YnbE family lipoprotein [Marinobacter panjinensis]TKV64328.1 YnbE family lipoprotein [Marinobacter panjinensis]
MDRYTPGRLPGKSGNTLMMLALALSVAACTPTVRMEAPKEPITVNLNVKIQHEIYVKVDKDVDELFGEKGLF